MSAAHYRTLLCCKTTTWIDLAGGALVSWWMCCGFWEETLGGNIFLSSSFISHVQQYAMCNKLNYTTEEWHPCSAKYCIYHHIIVTVYQVMADYFCILFSQTQKALSVNMPWSLSLVVKYAHKRCDSSVCASTLVTAVATGIMLGQRLWPHIFGHSSRDQTLIITQLNINL